MVSRCPGGAALCPSGVAVVSQWCRSGVMVLSQSCPGGVPVVSQWCPSDVPVVLQCVSVVSRCRSAGPVVSGVRVLSQWYPGRFPVVSRWCCRISSGVSVVSRWLVSQSQWCRVLLCVSVVCQCCSPIATRFGVYFLQGLCSCLRPFSENVRFGVPVFFPLGVLVVSRWCPCGVAVVSQWCLGGVMVLSQWCPGGVPMVFRWCSVSRRLVPLLEVGLLPVHRHLHGLLDVLLDGAPAVVYVDAGAEHVDSFEAAPVLLQNHADQRHGLARLARPKQYTSHRQFGDHRVLRLLARILGRRKQLYLAHGLSLEAGGRGTRGNTSFFLIARGLYLKRPAFFGAQSVRRRLRRLADVFQTR